VLLGEFNAASSTTTLFEDDETHDVYLKNCSCLGAEDGGSFPNTCGTGKFGSQSCPNKSLVGNDFRTYCCLDNSAEQGTNVWPGSCSTYKNSLKSGSFVPYQFYGWERSNFDDAGCTGDANCPLLTFSSDSEWDFDTQTAYFTLHTKRKEIAPNRSSVVKTCAVTNVRCLTDCATEVAYVIGIPDFLPTSAENAVTTAATEQNPPAGVCVANKRTLDSLANADGVRFPDTIILTKGRFMVPDADGRDFTACEANNNHGIFTQDAILARLQTISNYRDWFGLAKRDVVLQAFLRDPRFPPTTVFYWHPGNWIGVDNVSMPYGIQTDGDQVEKFRGGNRFSSVWLDTTSFTSSEDPSWRMCSSLNKIPVSGTRASTAALAVKGGTSIDRTRNLAAAGACSVFAGNPSEAMGSGRSWILPTRNASYDYEDENGEVQTATGSGSDGFGYYYMINNDFNKDVSKTTNDTSTFSNSAPAVSYTPIVRDAIHPERKLVSDAAISFCRYQVAGSMCVLQSSLASPLTCSTTCARDLCNTDVDCCEGYMCDTENVPDADNFTGVCRLATDVADDFSNRAVVGLCSKLDAVNKDTVCEDALELVMGDNADPDLTWCIRDNDGILLGPGNSKGSGSKFPGTCWVNDLRPFLEGQDDGTYDTFMFGDGSGDGGHNQIKNSNGQVVPMPTGCCLQNECTEEGVIALTPPPAVEEEEE